MINILDVFAGAGGFSCGFHMSGGYKTLGAIEYDKWAAETFAFNNPETIIINKDITTITDKEIIENFKGKIDLIIGGPPCQGYSISNINAGDPKDPRNSLFREFIRVTSLVQPNIVIMENVPNLLNAKTESKELVIDIIKEELTKLGYNVYFTVLEATDFGVPQIRKRLFVIGSKIILDNPFPIATHKNPNSLDIFNSNLPNYLTVWDALSDLPDIDARQGSEKMEYDKEAYNDILASHIG